MDKKGEIYLDSRKFSIMFTYDRKGKMQFLIGYKLLISLSLVYYKLSVYKDDEIVAL